MIKISGINELKKNDFLGIASVSGATDQKKNLSGKRFLENLGFNVVFSDNIDDKFRFMSGEDRIRLKSFESLVLDNEINGIIFSRGGYGIIRILDLIDFSVFENCGKFIMGYSDNSILLNLIYEKSGLKTIHGPNLSEIEKLDKCLLKKLFNCKTDENLFNNFFFLNPGRAAGILKGGNLASITSLCGTDFFPDLDGSIFFIEDVNEPAYKIDRYLAQLKACKKLDKINGVLVGDFFNCNDLKVIEEIMLEYFKGLPVVKTDEFGHGRLNNPLVIGARVIIDSIDEIVVYG